MKTIHPVATFHSPLKSKFGIPRQSGVAKHLSGRITLEPDYRSPDALRGMEGFDYLWLVWGFSANKHEATGVTVRPPRLGGNERMGVFATRSPFRPNGLGLSSVRIERIELDTPEGPVIHVSGADLMDGTPIYDLKPYLPYVDAHPEAHGGFTDTTLWQPLQVEIPDGIASSYTDAELKALREVLENDPRPPYHHAPDRIYGMPFGDRDIKFKVSDGVLSVVEAVKIRP